jgi:D-methionine transport system permease protein
MWDNFSPEMLALFGGSLWETLVMVTLSGVAGALIGIPLGVLLRLTDRGGVLQNTALHRVAGGIVNAVRSTPFIILLVAIIPLTRLLTGSSIGTAAAVVPLTVAAAPFIARLVETALREVDAGLVEAAQAMGATASQIVFKVLLPEALPGIVAAFTVTLVSLTGFSAMAGAIGGGGLGDLGGAPTEPQVNRHSRGGEDAEHPRTSLATPWVPACAGMTGKPVIQQRKSRP